MALSIPWWQYPGMFIRRVIWLTLFSALAQAAEPARPAAAMEPIEPPEWLFPIDPDSLVKNPAPPPELDDKELLEIPDSTEKFTLARINDPFNAPDWRPASHGPMPEIVAKGRKPHVMACAFCHTPTGQGRPENSPLAGLPEAYIKQQLLDYRSGRRKATGPGQYLPVQNMVKLAKALTDQEIDDSARYFSQQKLRRRVYVIESLRIPRAERAAWIWQEYSGTEDLGGRMLEVTQDLTRHERRDDRLEYLAYVPPGSINRGKRLVVSGKSFDPEKNVETTRTVACTQCHLANLKGNETIPAIAGRPPTYQLRQMLAFRNGTRGGEAAAQMNPVVEKLTLEEMIDIVGYLASLPP
jgi:cytochrome c553